jgi:hypothetical protein
MKSEQNRLTRNMPKPLTNASNEDSDVLFSGFGGKIEDGKMGWEIPGGLFFCLWIFLPQRPD